MVEEPSDHKDIGLREFDFNIFDEDEEDFSRKQTRIQMNGGGQSFYSMDLIPRAIILQPVF